MKVDARARMGALNNADLYEAIFAAHGLRYRRAAHAFIALEQPPPYYGHITVLCPDHPDEVMDTLRDSADRFGGRIAIKDSFSQFDLAPHGFSELFAASWIWREPSHDACPDGWHRIETPQELAEWEEAWRPAGSPTEQRVFLPSLLARDDFSFLARRGDSGIEAGCLVNLSSDCAGFSNHFDLATTPDRFGEALRAAAAFARALPLTGYESADSLRDAQAAGAQAVGDLRVFVTPQARF